MRKNCCIVEGQQDNITIISAPPRTSTRPDLCYPVFLFVCKLEIILLNLYSDCEIVVSTSTFSYCIRFLCCIINYKFSSLKQYISIYYLTVSMGQDSGNCSSESTAQFHKVCSQGVGRSQVFI